MLKGSLFGALQWFTFPLTEYTLKVTICQPDATSFLTNMARYFDVDR